jgi:hypothetical protein
VPGTGSRRVPNSAGCLGAKYGDNVTPRRELMGLSTEHANSGASDEGLESVH